MKSKKKQSLTLHKKRKELVFHWHVLSIIFPVVLGITVILTGHYIYESRAIPELHEENQMTILPQQFHKVLGSKAGLHIPKEVQIRIPIFLYHYVEYVHNDPARQNLNIPPNVLTAQIETLKNAGYTFITPEDLTAGLSGKEKISSKSAILSFDDGYMDLYTDVLPILQAEKVKAVAYIVPDFLDRPNYLFTFQLQQLARSPYIEIGAHTMDHISLAGISKTTLDYQVAQSRKVLQELLHLPINSFAYPYGSFDTAAVQAVKDAGFSNAVSTVPGIVQAEQNKFFLYRLRPGYRRGQELLSFLLQDTFKPW